MAAFHQMLERLGAEHDATVAELRAEIAALRGRLEGRQGPDATAPPAQPRRLAPEPSHQMPAPESESSQGPANIESASIESASAAAQPPAAAQAEAGSGQAPEARQAPEVEKGRPGSQGPANIESASAAAQPPAAAQAEADSGQAPEAQQAPTVEKGRTATPGKAAESEAKNSLGLRLRAGWAVTDEQLEALQPSMDGLKELQALLHPLAATLKRGSTEFLRGNSLLNPSSLPRLLWDFLALVFLMYDAVTLPISLIETPRGIEVSSIAINIFWLTDVLVNFRTGFFSAGKLVMKPSQIAWRYLKGWFAFDVFCILPGWTYLILQATSVGQDSGQIVILQNIRMVRMVRYLAVLRLVRLTRFSRVFDRLSWKIVGFSTVVMWVTPLMWVLLVAHVLACMWYNIGDDDAGWVQAQGIQTEALTTKYLSSIHWSMSQLQGSSNVFPHTFDEYGFAIFVQVMALIMSCFFVSSVVTRVLTNSRLQQRKADCWALATHLSSTSKELTGSTIPFEHIQAAFEGEFFERREEQVRQADLLPLLPRQLVRNLMTEMRSSTVRCHPLFALASGKFPNCFLDLLSDGFHNQIVAENEVVFRRGDACDEMRFIAKGYFEYKQPAVSGGSNLSLTSDEESQAEGLRSSGALKSTTSIFTSAKPDIQAKVTAGASLLRKKQWISEAALWTVWENQGKLKAVTPSTLFVINAEAFQKLVFCYRGFQWVSTMYARQFILQVNEPGASDIMMPPASFKWDPDHIPELETVEELPFETQLPAHVAARVCRACVILASDIAANGLDERRPHHGFTIIVGSSEALKGCGRSDFNPFQGNNVSVLGADGGLEDHAVDLLRRNAFHADGAIVVDGISGRVMAAGWFVSDISLGGTQGGARSRSARAVAQQAGGCFVIKASEDSRGTLHLHLHQDSVKFKGQLTMQADDNGA